MHLLIYGYRAMIKGSKCKQWCNGHNIAVYSCILTGKDILKFLFISIIVHFLNKKPYKRTSEIPELNLKLILTRLKLIKYL